MTLPVFREPASLVGHRGMGKGIVDGRRENTLESFLAAVELGAEWLEVDVQRTADDDLLVRHDATLPDGRLVGEATAQDAVDTGALRLTELLEALPPHAGVVFDVKSSITDAWRPPSATTAALLARACSRELGDRPAAAMSFDPAALQHMRAEAPELALGLLTWMRFPIGHAIAAAAHLDVRVLAVHGGSLWRNASNGSLDIPAVETVVAHVHEMKRQLLVWCPAKRRSSALVAAGVDAMVVDDLPYHVHRRDLRRHRPVTGRSESR